MKTCPSCHRVYEDDSLMFCLQDGAALLQPTMLPSDPNATLRLPTPPVTQPGPTVASPQPPVPHRPEPMQWNPPPVELQNVRAPEPSRRSALPWILGIVVVMGIFGVIIALILTRSRNELGPIARTPTPAASPAQPGEIATPSIESPTPAPKQSPPTTTKSPERQPKKAGEDALPGSITVTRAPPKATPERPKPMFSVMNNISFNGSRITYYPRPSFGLCQADCAGNANCRGITWIRAGAYNPGDSAMCYLLSAVTQKISHPCCISAVKN